MFSALLCNDPTLNEAAMDRSRHLELIQKLLLFSAFGLAVHGLVVGFLGQVLVKDSSTAGWSWLQGYPALWMPMAFVVAFVGALVVCLPSFYFYTQLAGLDASFGLIVVQSLRVIARTSVLILGVQPFFLALALAAVLGLIQVDFLLVVGLIAPFLVGFAGIASLHKSFKELVKVLPITHERRGNFILRFILAWGVLYLTVAPVALWKAGDVLGKVI